MEDKILQYINTNNLRITNSRKILIEITAAMEVFSTDCLINKAKEKGISLATTYNFIQTLTDADIIQKQEQYIFKSN